MKEIVVVIGEDALALKFSSEEDFVKYLFGARENKISFNCPDDTTGDISDVLSRFIYHVCIAVQQGSDEQFEVMKTIPGGIIVVSSPIDDDRCETVLLGYSTAEDFANARQYETRNCTVFVVNMTGATRTLH